MRRASSPGYPTDAGHGVGLGGLAEMLLDGETHAMSTFGALATVPFARSTSLLFEVDVAAVLGLLGSAAMR